MKKRKIIAIIAKAYVCMYICKRDKCEEGLESIGYLIALFIKKENERKRSETETEGDIPLFPSFSIQRKLLAVTFECSVDVKGVNSSLYRAKNLPMLVIRSMS